MVDASRLDPRIKCRDLLDSSFRTPPALILPLCTAVEEKKAKKIERKKFFEVYVNARSAAN